MVSLAAWGHDRRNRRCARIAAERSVGWNRQLRLPAEHPQLLRTKVLTGYLMALVSLVLLYLSGRDPACGCGR